MHDNRNSSDLSSQQKLLEPEAQSGPAFHMKMPCPEGPLRIACPLLVVDLGVLFSPEWSSGDEGGYLELRSH